MEICSAGPFSAAAADGLTGQAADLIRRSAFRPSEDPDAHWRADHRLKSDRIDVVSIKSLVPTVSRTWLAQKSDYSPMLISLLRNRVEAAFWLVRWAGRLASLRLCPVRFVTLFPELEVPFGAAVS